MSDETEDEAASDDSEFELTTQQCAALATDPHVAVTAGAGTGKTTTLTERYVELLADGVDPTEILTITFTDDAAGELRERVRATVDDRLDAAIDEGVGTHTSPSDASDDDPGYDHWRSVADAMADAYVHTIHESCARLRSEFAVTANVHPDVETLDESDAGVLARRTVRESVGAMLDAEDDRHADVTRLGRLWSRSELETVLVGLVDARPESREWVDRWRDTPADAHADAAWQALYPVSVADVRDRLTCEQVQSALTAITEIDPNALGIDPATDDGADFVRTVQSICRATGITDGSASGRDWQLAFDRLCDRLTTGDGDPYSGRSVHYYRGAKGTWDAHEATQERLETAGRTLIDVLDPGDTPFVGGTHADENAAPYLDALVRVTDRVLTDYAARKRDRTALDFDDLVADTVRLLREVEPFRAAVREQFDYVMVDEMQDTDDEQWELVRLLAGADPETIDDSDTTPTFDANLFLVGDEKQSIYRFRGADVTTFGAARETLAAANADGDTDTVSERNTADTATEGDTDDTDGADTTHADLELSGNFRTLDAPREFCNQTFDRLFAPVDGERAAFEAAPQSLSGEREDSDRPGSVEYLLVPDEDDPELHGDGYLGHDTLPFLGDTATREATAVAARLSRLLADPPTVYDEDADTERPARPEDVTVLLRARTRLPEYERALDAVDVPYTVASGTGFWDTPEVRTLVGLLEVLADPTDDTALYGLLRSPVFGFTDETLARPTASEGTLWTTLQTAADGGDAATGSASETESDSETVRDPEAGSDPATGVDEPVPRELVTAAERIADWRATVGLAEGDSDDTLATDSGTGDDAPSWGQFLSRVLTETGYLGALAAGERPQQAVANVERFREQIRDWADGGSPTLGGLLTRIRDRRAVETHAAQATVPDDVDGVRLRTIHSAKGLEFPVVVVPEIGREFAFGASADDDGKVYLDRVAVGGEDAAGDGDTVPLLGIKAPSPTDAYDHVGTLARRRLRDRDRRRERVEQRRLLYVATTRTRDHLVLSGHHSVENGDDPLALDEPEPHGGGRRWRDWLAPLLLGDGTLRHPDEDDAAADARATATADTLATLRDEGTVSRSLDGADYTVRVPPVPAPDWRSRRDDTLASGDGAFPGVEVSPVDVGAPPVATTATTYGKSAAPEVDRRGSDERDGSAGIPTDRSHGLDANERGTVVHELLERRPPRDEWRAIARRRASGLGDPTDADIDAICEHAARGLATREAIVERVEPDGVYEELSVTARVDGGRVVGEIDVLLVTDDRYVVLDYKTDTTAGVDVDELAATHWPQLRVYAAALAERDDDRTVELCLCFTDVDGVDERVRSRSLDVFDLDDCRADIGRRLAERRSSGAIHRSR